MMKETPIIMSGNHPKLILDGIKTQTRRVVKGMALEWLQPDMFTPEYVASSDNALCLYGEVGDRLWVRETWAAESKFNWTKPSEIPQGSRIFYLVDSVDLRYAVGKTRPSIFIPRWASRITLEITEVRVERLQEIGFRDCEAEGIYIYEDPWKAKGLSVQQVRMRFARLWDSLNVKRGYGWSSNPFCWVLSFKKLEA